MKGKTPKHEDIGMIKDSSLFCQALRPKSTSLLTIFTGTINKTNTTASFTFFGPNFSSIYFLFFIVAKYRSNVNNDNFKL